MFKTHLGICTLLMSALFLPSNSKADLVLDINNLTADEFSFSISGSFDADVVGDQQNWLAVKPDYQNNFGANVDWIDNGVGGSTELSTAFTVVTNTISIDDQTPISSLTNAIDSRGDSIYFNAGFDILAGMTVSGTVTVQSTGAFDPLQNNFELASGFNNSALDWARFEGSAIPEPGSLSVLGAVSLVAFFRRRKR